MTDIQKEVFFLKELIGKLSRGIIEYNLPEVEVSVTDIDKSIEAGELYHGSFEILVKMTMN